MDVADVSRHSFVSEGSKDDPFANFDWERTESDASQSGRGAGAKGSYPINDHVYEQVDYEPSDVGGHTHGHARSQSVDIHLTRADASPRREHLERQKAASYEDSLEVDRLSQKQFLPVGITVEDHSEGISPVSRSPGSGRGRGMVDSPRFSPHLR